MQRESIELALHQLLDDARIAASPQMTAFICYVVEKTLDDQASRIKAYSVGVDALGKPETFDPQSDASVRVLAARLRKTLERYNGDLPEGAVTISLVRGSYVPEFAVKELSATPTEPANSAVAAELVPGSLAAGAEVFSPAEAVAPVASAVSSGESELDSHATSPAAPVRRPSRLPRVAAALLAIGVVSLLLNLPAKFRAEATPSLAAATGSHTAIPADAPIVFIETPGEQHETARQVAFVLGGVLGQFDHIDVRQARPEEGRQARSVGCYSMIVSVLPTESRMIVGVQVVHDADGQLMFADSQDVIGDNPADLTQAIDRLRESVSQLAQIGGSLTGHFGELVAASGTNSGTHRLVSLQSSVGI